MTTIITHELLKNLKSLQFMMLIVFSILLFSMNGFVFVSRIQKKLEFYNQTVTNTKFRSTTFTSVIKSPSLLMFIAEGNDKYRDEEYYVYPSGYYEPSLFSSINYNYKMPDATDLDWIYIIKIIFSLTVLLLAYDSVSGEKEQGTLPLILSNHISRFKVIIGKYASILITILLPLIIGITVNIIIITYNIPQVISLENLMVVFVILLLSVLFLSIIIFIGLIVSSLINQSSLVLLSLLSIWILFFVIPEISTAISQQFSDVQSEYTLAKKFADSYLPISYRNSLEKRIKSGEFSKDEEVIAEGQKLVVSLENYLQKIHNQYESSIKKILNNVRLLSRISPMSVLQYISENICGTGLQSYDYFFNDIKTFSLTYDNYIIDKTGILTSPLIFTRDMDSYWGIYFKEKFLNFNLPNTERYQGNMDDFPVFKQKHRPIYQKIFDSKWELFLLLYWNVCCAAGAYYAFSRTSVR